MESLDPQIQEEQIADTKPDPEVLLAEFKRVATLRERAKDLFQKRGQQRGLGAHYPYAGRSIEEGATTALKEEEVAREALNKIIQNDWMGRHVRIARQDKRNGIQPTSHHDQYASVSEVEGRITSLAGYDYPNTLLIQTSPDLPYYVTYVLGRDLEPLITIELLDEE